MSRFEREAQTVAALESPHTVAIFDFGLSETLVLPDGPAAETREL